MRRVILLLFLALSLFGREIVYGVLERVKDGDTFLMRIGGEEVSIRLFGIDTPEKFESSKLYRDVKGCGVGREAMKEAGKAATNFAKSVMKVGEKYKVELMEGSSHGRLIGWVYLRNGTPYNVAVVKEGYAVVYSRYAKQDPRKYRQLMNALRYAKTHRTGLWREYPRIMECMERHYTEGKRYSSKGYHSQGLSLPRFW